VDVRDLDVRGVLAAAVAERRAADRAEARLLLLAVTYVDLHPVADDQLTRGLRPSPQRTDVLPEVAEHAVAGLGAVLGLSYGGTYNLVNDALTLRHRLPRLWALVQDGHFQAWKARKVAQALHAAEGPGPGTELRPEVVAFLDGHLSVSARHNRLPIGTLGGLIHEALLRCDPDTADGREEAALAHRQVSFGYGRATAPCATAELSATLDVLDALDLDRQITDLAADMKRLGDDAPLGVRRAHALGMLANPQHVLDVFGDTEAHGASAAASAAAPTPAPAVAEDVASNTGTDVHPAGTLSGTPTGTATGIPTGLRSPIRTVATTLYLHVSTDDLAAARDGSGAGTGARVEKLGAATLDLLRDWLRRSTGVTIRPVLDTDHLDPVDRHDPPEALREAVILRDRHCVFPACTADARSCDLDHIVPYVPLDQGGARGQTNADNLACLCRRHHRLKTFTAWTYQRDQRHDPDGHGGPSYRWTSPHGHQLTTHLRR
jgi:hypothetical protein